MVVDFHTHILPSFDDGSKNVEESIQMLALESKQGIKEVVLTPHFYPREDDPKTYLERRNRAYKKLCEEVSKYEGLPTLYLGAEVYYFDGISKWEGLKALTIENTNYVLIEMPMAPWSKRMYQELEAIVHNLGLIPIIAHMDRYIRPFKTYDIPNTLAKLPVLVQVNGSFFLKPSTSLMALKLLKDEKIQLLGSDCHNLESRSPNLEEVTNKIVAKLGKTIIETINAYEKQILMHIRGGK